MKRWIALWVVCVLLGGNGLAYAQAIDDSLAAVFDNFALVNTNVGGVFESQQRGYLAGGNLRARFISPPFRAWTVQPPSLSAGCHGVDLYLGSFSYASIDRYVDLLNQLGTGAVLGFAFQLALKEICETCANVLNLLETASRHINQTGRIQPCKTGWEIGKAVAHDLATSGKSATSLGELYQRAKERVGSVGDVWETRDDDAGKTTTQVINEAMDGNQDDPRGNLVWYTLVSRDVDQQTARLIMSALGTVIVDDDGLPQIFPAVASYEDIMEVDAGEDIRVYQCQGGFLVQQCLDLLVANENNVTGFRSRVRTMLLNILTKMQNEEALEADEIAFIEIIPQPIYAVLVNLPDPQVGPAVIERMAPLVAAEMAYHWLKWAFEETSREAYKLMYARGNWEGGTLLSDWKVSNRDRVKEAQQAFLLAYQVYEAENVAVQGVSRSLVKRRPDVVKRERGE